MGRGVGHFSFNLWITESQTHRCTLLKRMCGVSLPDYSIQKLEIHPIRSIARKNSLNGLSGRQAGAVNTRRTLWRSGGNEGDPQRPQWRSAECEVTKGKATLALRLSVLVGCLRL